MTCSLFSEKGGVGKSSLVAGVASVAAAVHGLNVVVVDGDPRATATDELAVRIGPDTLTLNDLLYINPADDEPPDPADVVAGVLQPAGDGWPPNLRVIAAERNLANREADPQQFDFRLRQALAALDDVDLVLCDLPPRAGGRLVSALLTAADTVLMPTTLAKDGYEGVRNAGRTLRLTRQGANPDLRDLGIVRSNVPRGPDRRRIHDEIDRLLEETWPGQVLPAQVLHYAVREECRYASAPITSAPGRQAKTLVRAYGMLVEHIMGAEAAA